MIQPEPGRRSSRHRKNNLPVRGQGSQQTQFSAVSTVRFRPLPTLGKPEERPLRIKRSRQSERTRPEAVN
jgi:hypothetical protein